VSEELGELWLVRHGQSLGNVAHAQARELGSEELDIAQRDMDVPLSDLGRRQAEVLGTWIGRCEDHERPEVVVASPYVRTVDTARLALAAGGLDLRVHTDERLREREFGILDLLTREGIAARYPDELRRRDRLGKFYHRPPGGESWVDVALRLRSLRDSLVREHAGRRVLLVTHEVVIIVMRYLVEGLDEAAALGMSARGHLANCSLTTYRCVDGSLRLDRDAWTAPLEEADTPVTEAPDVPVAPR